MIKQIVIDNFWLIIPGGIIFLIVGCLYLKMTLNKIHLAQKLASSVYQSYLLPGINTKKLILRGLLVCCALFFTYLAALKIQYDEHKIILQQKSRTILFALDISRSMLATDVSPSTKSLSRLDLAKLKIKSICQALQADRVGLLIFAEKAFLHCPFTIDSNNLFLDYIDATSVSNSAKTSFINAFEESLKVFQSSNSSSNILIMITDGEDFDKQDTRFVQKAKDARVAFLALGIGSEQGAPVPIVDNFGKLQGHEKDSQGNLVLTKLDFANLKNLAENLQGQALKASFGQHDVSQIIKFIEKFEKENVDDAPINLYKQTYHYFAGLAGLILMLELGMGAL